LPGNRLFIVIISDCIFGRDINGRLDLNVFLKVVDIYSEVMNLDAHDKLDLLRKARIISGIEEEKKDKAPLGGGDKAPSRGANKRIKILKGKRK